MAGLRTCSRIRTPSQTCVPPSKTDRAKPREITSKNDNAAHLKGAAHEFSSEEAREAGTNASVDLARQGRRAPGVRSGSKATTL